MLIFKQYRNSYLRYWILKLEGKDWWVNHSSWSISTGNFDWIVDTWIIDPTFWTGSEIVVAGSNNYDYWQPLFPDTINVSDVKVYVYPNIDVKHAWKDTSDKNNINPYIRLSITLEPSWKKRSGMQWEIPKYTINTTINLVVINDLSTSELFKINDNRIFKIFGANSKGKKIHYFDYIVEHLMPDINMFKDENIMLESFIKQLKKP